MWPWKMQSKVAINMHLSIEQILFMVFTTIFIFHDLTILPTFSADFLKSDAVESGTEEKSEVDDVCFPVEGCFSMKKPWRSVRRPMPAPASPNEIATAIYFLSRRNEQEILISISPAIDIHMAPFNTDVPIYVITHDIMGSKSDPWIRKIKHSLLKKVDANVFLVDWKAGAKGNLNYLQVASNTRMVGAQVERLLKHLIQVYNVNPIDMHLIGFGLGAHVLSYTAKWIKDVGRLTALDPTSAAFEGPERKVRLDPDDAELVEVVHTDARPDTPTPVAGGGMRAEYGDVDFYVNGGMNQPLCEPAKIIPNIKSIASFGSISAEKFYRASKCSHERAALLYAEAIMNTNCTFWGHPGKVAGSDPSSIFTTTNSPQPYMMPSLESCNILKCLPMGIYAHEYPGRGAYYVPTLERSPYCVYEPNVDDYMKKSVSKAANMVNKSPVLRHPPITTSSKNINVTNTTSDR